MSLRFLTIQSHVVTCHGGSDAVTPRDLNLIAMQDQLVNPDQHFDAEIL